MKRLTLVLLLVLLLSLSLMGVTLAVYVKEISYGDKWVGPKHFAFEADGSGQQKILRPNGSVSFEFSMKNFDASGVAQLPLRTAVAVTIPSNLAGTGRLVGELRCGNAVLASSFSGSTECAGNTLDANMQDSDTYTLTITWLDADMSLLGGKTAVTFDPSQFTVRVSAYQ